MDANYKKYYFYAHLDHNKEQLGICQTDDIGKAVNYFASIKNLPLNEFLKIYNVGVKNEHK